MIEFCLPREALDRWDQEFPFLSLPFLVGSTYHWGFLDTWIKLIPISVFGLDGGVRLPGDNFWDPDSKQIPFLSLCLENLGHLHTSWGFLGIWCQSDISYFSVFDGMCLLTWQFFSGLPVLSWFPFLEFSLMAGSCLPGNIFLYPGAKKIPLSIIVLNGRGALI